MHAAFVEVLNRGTNGGGEAGLLLAPRVDFLSSAPSLAGTQEWRRRLGSQGRKAQTFWPCNCVCMLCVSPKRAEIGNNKSKFHFSVPTGLSPAGWHGLSVSRGRHPKISTARDERRGLWGDTDWAECCRYTPTTPPHTPFLFQRQQKNPK